MADRENNRSKDITGESKIHLCGKDWRTAQALSQAHGVQANVAKLNKDVQDVYKLQKEESFTKRNSKLIKALIILSAIFLVGLLALIILNKAKSIDKENALEEAKSANKDTSIEATATGSKTADSFLKMAATTTMVLGGIGAVGTGIALGVTASKQKKLGETLEDFMDKSLKQTTEGKIDLQNQCIEGAKSNYSVLIDGSSDIAQAKIDQVIEKIDRGGHTGQVNVAENTFSKHDVEGACEGNNPYPCGKKSNNLYNDYERKDVSSGRPNTGLDQTRGSTIVMNNH